MIFLHSLEGVRDDSGSISPSEAVYTRLEAWFLPSFRPVLTESVQILSTARIGSCVPALNSHYSDEVDQVDRHQQTAHRARNLPIPNQSQEHQVNRDHDR